MKKRSISFGIISAVAALIAWGILSEKAEARGAGNPRPQPVVYVESQGLYYDSIVTADPVPPFGPFQELYMSPNGLTTGYGPGDPEYVGGRWVEDIDGDGIPHFFLCPLMGPGRETP